MNETGPLESSAALIEATRERIVPPARRAPLAAVRTSPGGHLAVAAVFTFASLILLRNGYDLAAMLSVVGTWIVIPVVIATDRISFDGEALTRRGLIALWSRVVKGRTIKLRVADIERAETTAVRTVRRGGRVRYRYRTEVSGKGASFVFASGRGFRQLVRLVFESVGDDRLDARTVELRDYLTDPKSLRQTLTLLRIASTSVLDNSVDESQPRAGGRIRHQRAVHGEVSSDDIERARLLRVAGNQLRVAGRLRESAEAFRRALLATPGDAALLYDFSRLLRSQASALGQAKLLSRAGAALRLAAFKLGRSADGDGGRSGRLLARMGETFLEFGNAPRAARAFRSALEINPRTFRAQLGLADVALRDGKLAHVIHHYNDAARIAPDESLKRFARKESEYYSRLNDDEDYLAGELRRITWLQGSQRVQRLAARASFASILVALIGPSINPLVAGIGLAVATSSVTAWVGTLLLVKFLKPRRRFPQDV